MARARTCNRTLALAAMLVSALGAPCSNGTETVPEPSAAAPDAALDVTHRPDAGRVDADTGLPELPCFGFDCIDPPPAQPGTGPGVVLALASLDIGAGPADGWKQLGLDIDGLISTKTSTKHCKVNEGGNKASVQTDGNAGRDNSFGENVLPILLSLDPQMGPALDAWMAQGRSTLLFAIDNLGDQPSETGLSTTLYLGAELGHAPAWDGTDEWPVACDFLETCWPHGTPPPPGNRSKLRFVDSFTDHRTWVSAPVGDVPVVIAFNGSRVLLRIHHAQIVMKLRPGSPVPQSATNGVISGILYPEEILDAVRRDSLRHFMCDEAMVENIGEQLRATADILRDGTQDPDALCDGISIGLGFEAKAAKLGRAADQALPEIFPILCPDM
jgi:hypothetical protein